MSNKDYYARWVQIKQQINETILEDARIQEFARVYLGFKPQATAVELIGRVYGKYCTIYNNLCECYDQMEQVQRRPYIKTIIDAVTCRLLEMKWTLEEVEAFEFTYPENALVQMLMVPDDVRIVVPYHYPFEIRQEEMQYIMDQIFSGNRLGDPLPTDSELEIIEQERLAEQERLQEEKEAEFKRKMAMGEDISLSEEEVKLSPEEIAELEFWAEYNKHIWNIQRMERSRIIIRQNTKKKNKDATMILELSGTKTPLPRQSLCTKAAQFIQQIYRRYIELKREHFREKERRRLLGMFWPSWCPPSAKFEFEKVKQVRREFRRKYYQELMAEVEKENARVFRLREGSMMEDISDEIRQWFREWYDGVRLFDEFPFPEEGGSILIVRGETFTLDEFIEWRTEEEKREKAAAGAPKTKEQIKQEKAEARLEKKRLEAEAKVKEKKRLEDYRKSRLNPDGDPGVYITIANNFAGLQEAWDMYENQWKELDSRYAPLDIVRGFVKQFITDDAYKGLNLQLRPIVDEIMKLELALLKKALKDDCDFAGITKVPQSKKRKKPKKVKKPKPEKITPEFMFQKLADEGIVRRYPRISLDDFWGDQNYGAADLRAIPWVPSFPPPSLGDVREQVRVRCILTLGSNCPNAVRSQLLVGPKGGGKRTLVYAIASETNALLIDLSPENVYDKFPGPKNLKTMFQFVNKISRMMQPTVILVNDADKVFYKKVPKEEKWFDPQRLSKDFFKEIIKPIGPNDKILVLGTASEPWLAKGPQLSKVYSSLILLPRSDYGSITLILTKMLMKYHGMARDFNVHCVAQALRGYDVNSIRRGVDMLMSCRREVQLYHKPLDPQEVVDAVLSCKGSNYVKLDDYQLFNDWYISFSPWGQKYLNLMQMLESQLMYKMKAEKKKNG